MFICLKKGETISSLLKWAVVNGPLPEGTSGLPRNAREDDSKQWEKVNVELGLSGA